MASCNSVSQSIWKLDRQWDEVLLLCPMLTVSDEVKPPWIVQMIFKYAIARLLHDIGL